ncbi:MAG TPA: AAA family ATPase [Planctomycetaceae bacterium]|nr:AAA family ATPase [Planctomycetaceae bacterium]
MPPLKPWYKVISPREDLRENRPLDASEFAVHLDHVREGTAPPDYQDAKRFFDRTFLTKNLSDLAVEVLRRLSGVQTETNAVFNMSTQFGGGKTHALTLLFHLAKAGSAARSYTGLSELLTKANIRNMPECKTAVFVGTEFDALTGRGGDDGTPKRLTPWGEIAWQIGGPETFELVAGHDAKMIAPAGDVFKKIFPENRPTLILMDEIMNYISRSNNTKVRGQFDNFLHNISEFARSRSNLVLAISVPASQLEMNSEEQIEFERIKKILDRLGKPVVMSVESETSEIIRRRLFEWGQWEDLKKDAKNTAKQYADWIVKHREEIPQWFPIDDAVKTFEATYPFHPSVISVFERKWQSIPRFQRTRGVLRLLALWVADAFQQGFKGNQSDPLIGLGTAPLDNSLFRTALFEQLGEPRLEPAVTTDICGKPDSHAERLDHDASEMIKKSRMHRKVATSIFFESNGGQTQDDATLPEVRLAVGDPTFEIGNVETVLGNLTSSSYYLTVEGTKYHFSIRPNLNKLHADRSASVKPEKIKETVRDEIKSVFGNRNGVKTVFFPGKSMDVPDQAIITFVVLSPEQNMDDPEALQRSVQRWTDEYGNGVRRFKNALIWIVPETAASLEKEARAYLAWKAIQNETSGQQLDASQLRQLEESLKKSKRDLREAVWRCYKYLMFLGKDRTAKTENLGLVHSSAADSLLALYIDTLRRTEDIVDTVGTAFLIKNWPPALTEWPTKKIKEDFFATPEFPRLLKPDELLQSLVQGVHAKRFAYVGKGSGGRYEPFYFGESAPSGDIEISDDMYIIQKETAEKYLESLKSPKEPEPNADTEQPKDEMPDGKPEGVSVKPAKKSTAKTVVHRVAWSGEVNDVNSNWMKFYRMVLAKFISPESNIRLEINFDAESENGYSQQTVDEAIIALRDLGLDDSLRLGDK